MIKNKYTGKDVIFSCEVFPPKRNDDMYEVFKTLDSICEIKPDFISVTYGAGGSNSKKTATIAAYIQNICEVPSLAHITAVGMDPEKLQEMLGELAKKSVRSVLCLRGDKPRTMTEEEFAERYYKYASDMLKDIKKFETSKIYAACYPEKHPESPDMDSDIQRLKEKVDLGVDDLITQLFFDNQKFYDFCDKAHAAGINVPIHAGIMPVTNAKMLGNSVSLSGSSVPHELSELIAKYADDPEAMKEAGIDYAVRQIEDLLQHDVDGIHLYCMNKDEITKEIYRRIV